MLNILLSIVVLLMSTTIQISPTSITEEKIEMVEGDTEEDKIIALLEKEYKANEHYEDLAGVMYMEDFVLDIVMKPTPGEPEKYLYTTRDLTYHREGELFMSENSKFEEDSMNMARIYGHNMTRGTKFGQIKKLMHYDNNRPLYFYDGNKVTRFRLARGFKFIDGTDTFERPELKGQERINYLQQITSSYTVSHDDFSNLTDDEDVIFLQTCETAYGLRRDVMVFIEDGVL